MSNKLTITHANGTVATLTFQNAQERDEILQMIQTDIAAGTATDVVSAEAGEASRPATKDDVIVLGWKDENSGNGGGRPPPPSGAKQ